MSCVAVEAEIRIGCRAHICARHDLACAQCLRRQLTDAGKDIMQAFTAAAAVSGHCAEQNRINALCIDIALHAAPSAAACIDIICLPGIERGADRQRNRHSQVIICINAAFSLDDALHLCGKRCRIRILRICCENRLGRYRCGRGCESRCTGERCADDARQYAANRCGSQDPFQLFFHGFGYLLFPCSGIGVCGKVQVFPIIPFFCLLLCAWIQIQIAVTVLYVSDTYSFFIRMRLRNKRRATTL